MNEIEQKVWDITTNLMEARRHAKRGTNYYTAQEKDVIEIAIKEHNLTEDQVNGALKNIFEYGYLWECPAGTLRIP